MFGIVSQESNPEVRQLCAALLFISTKKRVVEREVRTSYDTVVYIQGKDGSYVRSYAEAKKVIYELPKLVKDVIYLVMDTYVKTHVKLSYISISHQIRELSDHASANFIKTGLGELGLDVEKLLDIMSNFFRTCSKSLESIILRTINS